MKKGIHPDNYRPVVFKDMSNEDVFITRSTINAKETIEIDGVTYPLVKIEISSSSHPQGIYFFLNNFLPNHFLTGSS